MNTECFLHYFVRVLLIVMQVTYIENGFTVVIITVTTIADYYIVAGVVYQAPDLQSVINSRVVGGLLYINLFAT